MKAKYTYDKLDGSTCGVQFRVGIDDSGPYDATREYIVALVFTEEDAQKLCAALNQFEMFSSVPS